MWARVVEVTMGIWLAMSPFLFHLSYEQPAYWWNDFACGALVMTFALASFWPPTQHAHLLQIAVGLWLMGWAYANEFSLEEHASAAMQNDVTVGFMLLMVAILPNHSTRCTPSWEQLLLERHHRGKATT